MNHSRYLALLVKLRKVAEKNSKNVRISENARQLARGSIIAFDLSIRVFRIMNRNKEDWSDLEKFTHKGCQHKKGEKCYSRK